MHCKHLFESQRKSYLIIANLFIYLFIQGHYGAFMSIKMPNEEEFDDCDGNGDGILFFNEWVENCA